LSRTIIVAGIPGVGKTTVLQELETVAREKNFPLKIVNFGNVMNDLFKKRGKAVHRDHMRRQDLELQAKVQEQAANEIGKSGGKSAVVVDTHMFVRTKDGIWPGTPRRVLERLRPGLIILIEADPEDIAKRRNADRTRERDSKTVEEARADLEWSRYMASANAVLAGAPIQIVLNPDGHQRACAEDLLHLIQKRTFQ
jgi:adenylate kinase